MLLLFARSCFKASDGASVHADSYNHEVRALPFFGKWCGGASLTAQLGMGTVGLSAGLHLGRVQTRVWP